MLIEWEWPCDGTALDPPAVGVATAWDCSPRCLAEGGPHGPGCTPTQVRAEVVTTPGGGHSIVIGGPLPEQDGAETEQGADASHITGASQ
jgi:hypothetical protein